MSHIKSSRAIAVAVAALAAASLFAGIGVWFGFKDGVVAVVVTPRQYVPVKPGSTQAFSAVAHHSGGTQASVSTNGAVWQCDPLVGFVRTNMLYATNVEPAYGWVQASYSGMATRVYVKLTSSGLWNPDDDCDGDGFTDRNEIATNTSPTCITLENVKCRLTGI